MKVLVVSVHPDDETLGMGGTILKHLDMGDTVDWLIVTKMDESLGYTKKQTQIAEIQKNKVKLAYNFNKVYELGLLTTRLHIIDFSKIINEISGVINDSKPEIIYFINRSDIHTDHQIVSKAIFSCSKTFRYPFIKKMLMYECISETEFSPQLSENLFISNCFSDISKYMNKKIEIMNLYASELQEHPFPRSIENLKALAIYRGASCNCEYAEAFMLVKEVF